MLRFDAFGNRSATGGTDAYDPSDFQFGAGAGYQTGYASTTEPGLGLQYLVNRYYDPAIGRFISRDPLGFGGGLNAYGYVGNNPVMLVDPLGLFTWGDAWAFTYNYRQPIGWAVGGVAFLVSGGNLVAAAATAGATTGLISYLGNGQQLGYAAADGALSFAVVAEGIPALQAATGLVALQFAQMRGPAPSLGTIDGPASLEEGLVGAKGGSACSVGDFDEARRQAFQKAGMSSPADVKFSKVDPKTGTVVEFKGPGGAKVGYDSPHDEEGEWHDVPHISWQTGGKRRDFGRERGNIPYRGARHPYRSPNKGEGVLSGD